jgi:ELWxxDGT repeat protein
MIKIVIQTLLSLIFSSVLMAQRSFTKLDINTGTSSSTPRKFIEHNNLLYFTAFGTNGIADELYVTNGTQAGTQLVSNINTAFSGSSTPENLTVYNNELYFSAFTNTNGRELYKTNGTTVTLLKDISIGTESGLESSTFIELNGFLYFFAQDTVGTGYDLWRTDGTTNGTVKMVNLNSNSVAGNKLYFTKFNNELYFLAQDFNDITVGIELYKYNPTSNIVNLVVDLFPNNGQTSSIGYSHFTIFDNKLFFIADSKIRYTDGNTTIAVTNGALNLTAYANPKVLNNQLIFIGNSTNNGSHDVYKCIYDAALANYKIELVYNFNQTANLPINLLGIGFEIFTELNNKLYFPAREASSPNSGAVFQIYETDGITTKVAVPITYAGSPAIRNIYFITPLNGKIYYQSSGTDSPDQLWEADVSTGNFTQLSNYTPQANIPEQVFNRPMIAYKNELYFEGQKTGDGYELWKLNNTTLPSFCHSFKGSILKNEVVLTWEVSNQINTLKFIIEKSFNGIDFVPIGFVNAAGNYFNTILYSFNDKNPLQGDNYYRIKQIDNDGSYMYLCNVLKIQYSTSYSQLLVYPTIANNVVTIKLLPNYLNGNITLTNALGKTIFTQKITSLQQQLNVYNIANGAYILTVHNEHLKIATKIIIQH